MSAAEVLAQHRPYGLDCACGRPINSNADWSRHADEALKAAGYTVIKLPTVAHKGPHDTDVKFFRQVADRMEWPSKRIDYLGGSNVRQAVRSLLCAAADALEARS